MLVTNHGPEEHSLTIKCDAYNGPGVRVAALTGWAFSLRPGDTARVTAEDLASDGWTARIDCRIEP